MLACFHPLTDRLLAAFGLGLLVALVLLGVRAGRRQNVGAAWGFLARDVAICLGVFAVAVCLTLWLGSYSRSPLGFARQPVLRGFIVHKGQGSSAQVDVGDGFSISHSSLAFITPLLEPAAARCLWQSQQGAMVDLPDICDITYAPPSSDYDVLRLRVVSGCGLPDSSGNLRVAILP